MHTEQGFVFLPMNSIYSINQRFPFFKGNSNNFKDLTLSDFLTFFLKRRLFLLLQCDQILSFKVFFLFFFLFFFFFFRKGLVPSARKQSKRHNSYVSCKMAKQSTKCTQSPYTMRESLDTMRMRVRMRISPFITVFTATSETYLSDICAFAQSYQNLH